MADPRLASIIGHVRKLAALQQTSDASDANLLEQFIRQRDESAFAALVRRHGPLVWRVCRRLLQQTQDAEEVYQATFLVLARRAAKIRTPAALASFLYGVAYRSLLHYMCAFSEENQKRVHQRFHIVHRVEIKSQRQRRLCERGDTRSSSRGSSSPTWPGDGSITRSPVPKTDRHWGQAAAMLMGSPVGKNKT